MLIVPADVTEVKCLFYQHVLDAVTSEQYGITCNTEVLDELKKLFNHWDFQCYSNDFIRTAVLDSEIEPCENRDTSEPGIIS